MTKVRIISILIFFSFLVGCTSSVQTQSNTSDEVKEYIQVKRDGYLGSYEGRKILIEGILSDRPWQHLISISTTHPEVSYLDIDTERQTVVYTKDKINCKGILKIKGTVVKIQGKSKRPGSDEMHTEFQIVVDTWECVK